MFRQLLLSLRQQAEVLPTPVNDVVLNIAKAPEVTVITVATSEVDRLYDQEVLAGCRKVIADRYPFAGPGQPDVQVADFGAVFGHDGLFDKFFKDNLQAQVDTTRTPWTWKPGSVAPARRLLEQFEEAQVIRDMFFPPGAKLPEIRFAVTLSDLDAGTSKFVLTLDGQMVGVEPRGSVKAPGMVWPGPYPGRTEVAFDVRYFEPPIRYPGPWSLFRLIDVTMEGAPDAQQVVRLTLKTPSNHQVSAKVEVARAGLNPFASRVWRQFNCEL
jgi:type VI secretion system protein ImpL